MENGAQAAYATLVHVRTYSCAPTHEFLPETPGGPTGGEHDTTRAVFDDLDNSFALVMPDQCAGNSAAEGIGGDDPEVTTLPSGLDDADQRKGNVVLLIAGWWASRCSIASANRS
jgi:hypothetical protein